MNIPKKTMCFFVSGQEHLKSKQTHGFLDFSKKQRKMNSRKLKKERCPSFMVLLSCVFLCKRFFCVFLGDDVQIVRNTRVSHYLQVFSPKVRLDENNFEVHAQHVIVIGIYEGFHREKQKPRSWGGRDHIDIHIVAPPSPSDLPFSALVSGHPATLRATLGVQYVLQPDD